MSEVKLSRSRNAKRNMIFGLAYQILSLAIPFVTRTIIIRLLGAEYLGLSGLFSSILQVLNLSELGFGSAIVFSMYEPIAKNDTEELCALLKFYKKIYTIVGTAIFAGGLIVLPFLPHFIKGSWPSDINIYILYLLYLTNTGISYFLFAYKNSLFSAYQRNDMLSKIRMAVTIFTSLMQIAVLMLWKNYYAYVGVLIVASMVTNISVHFLSKKAFPNITCRGRLSNKKKEEIKVKVQGLMINKLCQTSRNALDSIFVSSFIGLVDTARYNNYFYILTAVSGIMNLVGQSIMAGVGNSIVTEKEEKNHDDMKKINFVYMWVAGWFATCMLCLYQPFTKLVFGADLLFPFSIVVMFVLYFYLLKMGDIRAVYSDAAGLWWENRYRAITEAVANLILNYALGKYFGVKGIIIATLVSLFLFNFLWGSTIIYQYYFKSINAITYYKQHLAYALAFLAASSISYLICNFVDNEGLLGLLIKGIICIILPNIVLFIIHFRTKQFKDSFKWVSERFNLPTIIRKMIP